QIMNINIGITENKQRNPFHGWNFGVIPYSTGDFHLGNHSLSYEDENGEKQKLYFCGYHNFRLSMEMIKKQFPKAERILIAGESAGAFAVPALAKEIIEDFYPECEDITVFSDSALLLRSNWKETLQDVWKAPKNTVESLHSENITLDWYEDLMKKMGQRCRYLYASSIEDYLLSSFQNEIDCGIFETNEEAQKKYYQDLKVMHEKLSSLSEPMHFFYYDWKNPLYTKGGTVHTAVRQPYFYQKSQGVTTMAHWLNEAVQDHSFNVGVNLLLK
nr:pectinacetylesterase family protein [Lachnospiraceae bacterium]